METRWDRSAGEKNVEKDGLILTYKTNELTEPVLFGRMIVATKSLTTVLSLLGM